MVMAMLGLILWILGQPPDNARIGPAGNAAMFVFLVAMFGGGARMFCIDVRVKCPGCGKPIRADEPWRCGACHNEHATIGSWGKYSFLGQCKKCEQVPRAYECHFCQTLLYLDSDEDGRTPARSLNPAPVPCSAPPLDPREQLKLREVETRHLQIDVDQLVLEIKKQRLNQHLKQPSPPKVSAHQERIHRIAEQLDDAELACRTIPDTVARELKVHADIDAGRYHPNDDTDLFIKEQMKRAASVGFEAIRLGMGADVRVQKPLTSP